MYLNEIVITIQYHTTLKASKDQLSLYIAIYVFVRWNLKALFYEQSSVLFIVGGGGGQNI